MRCAQLSFAGVKTTVAPEAHKKRYPERFYKYSQPFAVHSGIIDNAAYFVGYIRNGDQRIYQYHAGTDKGYTKRKDRMLSAYYKRAHSA